MKFNLDLIEDMGELLVALAMGLKRIDLHENTESFKKEDLKISAGKEVAIQNPLTFIPKQYVIVSQEGNGLVTKSSPNKWSDKAVYIKNNGSEQVTITIIFMR